LSGGRRRTGWTSRTLEFRIGEGIVPRELRKGQGVVEYALILALAVIVVIVALTLLGQSTEEITTTVANTVGNST
jgi:Flp pilus assembly pilin Flp